MLFPRLSALLALSAVASAHYQLTYPPSRGFVEDDEVKAPCGGFNTVGTRTPFPLGDSYIKLASEHAQANVLVLISFVDNPTDIKNFTTTPSGAAQAPVRDFFQVDGSDLCIGLNIKSIGYPNATDGTKATLAIQYVGGDGNLFQCADITLSSSATVPSNVTCSNEYLPSGASSASAGPSATGSGSSSAAGTSTTSRTGAGHLTAGVSLGAAVCSVFAAVVSFM